MATVEGLTKARMLEIEAASVVSGEIDGSNHLILTRHDGSTIDAGLVASGGDMYLGTAQTVTAAKTFNAGKLLDKGSLFYDVKAYGAIGDGTTDDTAAIQSAVDAAQAAGGGTVWFGANTYKLVTNPIKLYSGTGSGLVGYNNIRLLGAGATLSQTTTGVDVVKCLNDVTYTAAKSHGNIFENIKLAFSGTATNSGNGIYLAQQAASGAIFHRWRFINVVVSNCQGSGKWAFNVEGIQATAFEDCSVIDCANGFNANGSVGSSYGSACNSSSFRNCYVSFSANAAVGFRIVDSGTLSLASCKVNYSANSTGTAYSIEGAFATKLDACSFELTGGATLTAGFKITENGGGSGSHQIVLDACRAYQSKSTKEVWLTTASDAIIKGFRSDAMVSGSTGLTVDGNGWVTDEQSNWPAAAPRTLSATAKWLTPGVTRVGFVTGNNTPAPTSGQSDMYFMAGLSGAVTVGAPTGPVDDAQIMVLEYIDNGVARAITHNAIYRSGPGTMVTTTVVGKVVREVFEYSSGAVKWTCIASFAAGF